MIVAKFLDAEHAGACLASALLSTLEDFDIADRLLGVTADNASNNSSMMRCLKSTFHEKFPDSGFSAAWNQVECIAHVVNLAAQEIMKNFKTSASIDTHKLDNNSDD